MHMKNPAQTESGCIRFNDLKIKQETCYSEEQVISMLEFLIDSIFVSFGGTLFQQVVGIPMGNLLIVYKLLKKPRLI
jgi:hypothetical protein